MNLYTLAELRENLWRYGPQQRVPYAQATQDQKDNWDEYLNQVCERLLGRMKPRYTMRRVNVPVYDGSITVPRELDGIDGIEMVDSNNCPCSPLQIYSRFHEWAVRGVNCCCSEISYVLSDMVQVFQDPDASTDGFKLKVVATEAGSPDIQFRGGYDDDWDQIFSTETLAFGNGSFTSTTIWKSMPQIIKPVTTNLVELYSVDVATSESTLIAVYAPGERIPAYKRYKVPEWPDAVMARIFGKLAFNEVTADNDIPIPNNIGALKAGMQALSYEDAADLDHVDALWNRALKILDEEMAEANDGETPTFRVNDQYGVGNLPLIM